MRTGYQRPTFQRSPDCWSAGGSVYSALSTCAKFFNLEPGKPGNPRGGRQRKVFDRLSKKLVIGLLAVSVFPTGALAQAPRRESAGCQGSGRIRPRPGGAKRNGSAEEAGPFEAVGAEVSRLRLQRHAVGSRSLRPRARSRRKALTAGAHRPPISMPRRRPPRISSKTRQVSRRRKTSPPLPPMRSGSRRNNRLAAGPHRAGAVACREKETDGRNSREAEYRKILELDPNSASTAYSLGTLILQAEEVERIPEALFWIARSVEIRARRR